MNGSHGSHWHKVHHHQWHRSHWGQGWHGSHGHRFNPMPAVFMLGLLFFLFGGFKFWIIPLVFFFILPMFAWKSKGMGWGCGHSDEADYEGNKAKTGDSVGKRKNDEDDPFYPEII